MRTPFSSNAFCDCSSRGELWKSGSGFSTAVMLDTIERFCPQIQEVTLVEPYADRVKGLLRDDDWRRTTLIEDVVQRLSIERFAALQAGDLLFIDSSHVMKCGSDLQVLHIRRSAAFTCRRLLFTFTTCSAASSIRVSGCSAACIGMRTTFSALFSCTIRRGRSRCSVIIRSVRPYGDWFANHMPQCLKNPGGSLYMRRTAD